jgi:hypothetical protein
MSNPEGPRVTRASIVVASHIGHKGRDRGNIALRLVFRRERYRALSHRVVAVVWR